MKLRRLFLARQIAFLWLAGLFANGIGWIFTLLANRSLSLEEMGTFGFYVSLITISSILSVALEITVNRFEALANHRVETESQMTRLLRVSCLIGLIAFGGFLLANAMSDKVSFGNFLSVFFLGTLFVMVYPLSWVRSMLQAKQLFLPVATTLFIEGVVKVGMGLVAFWWNLDLFGFLMAMPASAFVALAFSWYYFTGNFRNYSLKASQPLSQKVRRFMTQTLLMRVGLIALLSLDMVVAKWVLAPEEAGIYALVSLVGKMIYFANQSLYSLLTPIVSPFLEDQAKRRRAFLGLLLLTVAMSTLIVVTLLLFPAYSLGILLGARYILVLPYTLPYAFASVMVSLLFMFSLYDLLRERFWMSFSLLGALVIELILMALFHANISQIIENVIWASGLGLSWVFLGWFGRARFNYQIK